MSSQTRTKLIIAWVLAAVGCGFAELIWTGGAFGGRVKARENVEKLGKDMECSSGHTVVLSTGLKDNKSSMMAEDEKDGDEEEEVEDDDYGRYTKDDDYDIEEGEGEEIDGFTILVLFSAYFATKLLILLLILMFLTDLIAHPMLLVKWCYVSY